jgi:hypothetical protein
MKRNEMRKGGKGTWKGKRKTREKKGITNSEI